MAEGCHERPATRQITLMMLTSLLSFSKMLPRSRSRGMSV